MINKRDLKWREIRMNSVISGCPVIKSAVGDNLYDTIQKVCRKNEQTAVVADFQDGFVIPQGIKFYDAYFMALEQTDKASPEERLQEAAMIKKVMTDYKFAKDMEISLAFYRNEVLRENPSKAEEFSEQELVDTYKILSKMRVAENKIGLPYIESELQKKAPQLLESLKAPNTPYIDGTSHSL